MIKTTRELLKEPQQYFFNGKEKEFEEYIIENIGNICEILELPKIKKVKRQKRFDVSNFSIKPDVMIIHEDDTFSVFEIKCTNQKYPGTSVTEQTRAIGQLLLYKSVLREMKGASPRVFLIDQKIHMRTVCVFAEMALPITLVEIQNDRVFIPYRCHLEGGGKETLQRE